MSKYVANWISSSTQLTEAAAQYRVAQGWADEKYLVLLGEIRAARAQGMNITDISQYSGITRMTVRKHLTAPIADPVEASESPEG